MVKRILLTGMWGAGKSSVIERLAARRYRAVDLDAPGWSESAPDGEWIWREERVRELFASLTEDEALFLSGCAVNQVKFYPQFDKIVLLSAPADLIMERLATRTNNPCGKRPDELAATLENLETVEPLLRPGADLEIDTRAPFDDVVAAILRLLDG